MEYKRSVRMIFVLLICVFACKTPVHANSLFTATAESQRGQTVKIIITLPGEVNMTGFDICRLNPATNTYDLIGSMDFNQIDYYDYMDQEFYDDYWYNYYENANENAPRYRFVFNDMEVHTANQTYYYQVSAFNYDEQGNKVYLQTVDASVLMLSDAPMITTGKRSGKLNLQLGWTQDPYADGYYIYCVKDYDDLSNYISVDTDDLTQYSLVQQITSNAVTGCNFNKLMNGVTYTFRICSYKIVNGTPQISSMMSEATSVVMDYYSYDSESYEQRIKRAFGSEKKMKKNFKTAKKASKQMKTIKIKVWDFKNGKKGKKVTKTKYLTVNKRLATSIKAMFEEIYKSDEKQVIKDIGCYSYREGEHMYGMAIDINPNENYMVDGKKKLAGSFWNPKKSKYSIPLKCETVRILARYGFYRGFWGDRKDYMHFSYFGT